MKSRKKYTNDFLSNALAMHLGKVKKEGSEEMFQEQAQLIIYGSDLETDVNSTLRTSISLLFVVFFSTLIVRICFNFTRQWEKLKIMVAQRVLKEEASNPSI